METTLDLDPKLFRPSGLNSSFYDNCADFENYIQQMQEIIRLGRIDITADNVKHIIAMNSPFEFRPDFPTKRGILLLHGLYDSPYSIRDIASQLVKRGFLVRSILLPGHGTVPGDLLHIKYSAWQKAAYYGTRSLWEQVSELYLLGFSTGGTLALNLTLQYPELIKGLLLLAPAFRPRKPFVNFLLQTRRITSLFTPWQKWYQIEPQTTSARYESYACNAAYQACQLMKETTQLAKNNSIKMPIFMVLSAEDESIDSKTALQFFLQQKNEKNRLLFYTSQDTTFEDPRIILRLSAFPQQRILDLAHTGIPIAPENPHYGQAGDFKDFQHYNYDAKKYQGKEIYLGSVHWKNLRMHTLQRLSFNPDFSEMMRAIEQFLDATN